MKISVIVPVLNEEKNLPGLFKALLVQAKEAQIILVDNGSEDKSIKLLEEFSSRHKDTSILHEPKRGFAEPLNRAVAEASGDLLLFLDADAAPAPGWLKAMVSASRSADLIVGETLSKLKDKPTPYGRLAVKMFRSHSKRTAHAIGHALPWGPTCNLGVHRSWLKTVGPFSSEAAGAFDIDFCWRMVLAGARIGFAPKAVVYHERRNERGSLLRQFDRYGQGEAWLSRTYSKILGTDSPENPLLAGVEAFLRLKYGSGLNTQASLQRVLDEVAAAFSAGVRTGYERPYRTCPLERKAPAIAASWWAGKDQMNVFVPGKGLTTLSGKPLKIWLAKLEGKSHTELESLFRKLFKASEEEAEHALAEFLSELSPAFFVKVV